MMTIIFGILFLVFLLVGLAGSIWWIVDGIRIAKGTYIPSKAESSASQILLGALLTVNFLNSIVTVIVQLVK